MHQAALSSRIRPAASLALWVAASQGALMGAGAGTALAQPNGDVQWDRLSHAGAPDRRPICPVGGEAFEVHFQTARFDAEACRVGVDVGADGIGVVWYDAAWVASVGEIDLWAASVPGTTAARVAYVIEVIDGADRDYLSAAGVSDGPPATPQWWTIDFQSLAHAPLGSTPSTGGTVFRVWAPGASTADVLGEFNGWTASAASAMTRLGEDFVRFVPGAVAGQDYKYRFNGALWRPDPRGRFLDNNSGYDTRIIDPLAYQWQHPHFSPAPAEEWVVYQLHVGTFAGRNDPAGPTPTISRFADVTRRVGHLADLGVNAVMINPVTEFPGEKSGGYNPVSMFASETSYGTPDELKAMVDALHGAGIAVVFDTVWNHFTSSDNHLWQFDGTQRYFDAPSAVGTPWGPQADLDRPQVRQYYLDSVETFLGEYKADGYRHDAIYELVSASQAVPGQDLTRTSMATIRRRFPDAHVIGEVYNNSAWNTSPGGIDLDGQYHEAFKNAIDAAIDNAGFGDPDLGRLAASIDGSGPWVEGDRVFNYFELHDEAWPLSGAGRRRAVKQIDTTFPHDDRFALGRTKLANGLTILAQGVPAILMGNEWAEDADWEFEKLDWSKRQTYAGVFRFYKDLIALRTTKRALFANSPAHAFHVNDGANVMAFERTGWDGRSYVVVANFSNTDFSQYTVGLPRPGPWGLVINSESAAYQGRGVGGDPRPITTDAQGRDGHSQSARLTLPAHGFLLLQHEPEFIESFQPLDINRDGRVDLLDLYAIMTTPTDLNADLTADTRDSTLLHGRLRQGEVQGMSQPNN